MRTYLSRSVLVHAEAWCASDVSCFVGMGLPNRMIFRFVHGPPKSEHPPTTSGLASIAVYVLSIYVVVGCDTADVRLDDAGRESSVTTEVRVETDTLRRADFQFDPVSIPADRPFSVALIAENTGEPAARLVHERAREGYLLTAEVGSMGPRSVTVECRKQGAGVQRQAALGPSKPSATDTDSNAVALTDDEPTSFHYVKRGDTVIIEVDYNASTGVANTNSPAGPGASVRLHGEEETVVCTHVGFTLNGASPEIEFGAVRFRGAEAPRFSEKELQ